MGKAQFGLVGLAVMGENLIRNVERNGFTVAVYNRTWSRTEEFMRKFGSGKFLAGKTVQEFVAHLERPRRIMMLVKAGAPVDETIASLKPHLEKGDILIDGGNSYFKDTDRRMAALEKEGFRYLGTGVSGGEYGALHGPSIMPGGPREAYSAVEPIFKAISAKVNGEPCVSYIGKGSAGNYVKTVHNGVEYGDMQLIAEIYDILHRGGGLTHPELHDLFAEWNNAELNSYLVEITRDIFARKDEGTGKPLVELIVDEAQGKGTGKWTSQEALDLGIPIPTINAAVTGRMISALKAERVQAAKVLKGPETRFSGDKMRLAHHCRAALYAAKICSYAQGLAMLAEADRVYGYGLNLGEVARIWRGGCIIRAQLLELIRAAFARNPALPNLLLDPAFAEAVVARQQDWREALKTALDLGIPTPGLSESLAYFDSYRTARLPANLIQAQRDYFGAHTYKRIDKEGSFHTEWQPE